MAALLLALVGLAGSIGGALVSIGGVIVALPGDLVVYFGQWILQIGAFIWAQLQNWKFTLVVIVSVAFVVVLGPVALNQTSSVMAVVDIGTECGYRPTYEAVSKTVLYNTRVTGQTLLIGYNKFVLYTEDNFKRFIVDAKSTFHCISTTLDISQILVWPYQFWVDFVGPTLYGFYSQPLPSKREIFPNGEWGLHDPMINNNQEVLPNGTVPIANLTRYEFNPNFGAQGPPVVPATRLFVYFPLRDILVSWSNVLERAGNLLFRIIADLRRPAQLFFPNLIVDVTSELSYWREGADLTCIAVEATLFMSFIPWQESDGFQTARYYYEVYACKLLRIVACLLARISLLLNDLTTINRPAALDVNCAPAQNDPNLALNILRGIPVLDIFITQFEEPLVLHNLNIFRSDLIFCQYMRDDARLGAFNAPQTQVVNLELYQQMIQCGIIAAGSYPSTADVFGDCQVWDGINPPTEQDRIDYIALILECVTDILLLAADPLSTNTSLDTEIKGAMALVAEFLNQLITRSIYFINSFADPVNCRPDFAAVQWFKYLNQVFIDLLEYIYRPDTCIAAVPMAPTTPPSFILCFIALASRANDPGFTALCPAISFLSTLINGGWTLSCSKTRKRSLLATDRFGPHGENEHTRQAAAAQPGVSLFQNARMYSMYYSYHARDAWRRSAHCWDDANVSIDGPRPPLADCSCALAPCMGDLLQCFEAAVPADNPYRAAVIESGTLRNVLIGAVSMLDTARGCDDSVLAAAYRTLATLVEVGRDLTLRYLVVAHKYTPTLERCMAASAADHAAGVPQAEVERRFLACVGLEHAGDDDVFAAAANNSDGVWSTVLERSGIVATDKQSSCAELLHREGLVLDDVNDTRALDYEHAHYRTCTFLLAFGAAANADRRQTLAAGNRELAADGGFPLTDYLRFYSAPLALLSSTSHIDARHYDAILPGFAAALPPLPFDSLPQQTPRQYFGAAYQRWIGDGRNGTNAAADEDRRKTQPNLDGVASALYSAHPTASVLYAYVQYLADVYEKAALVESSGEEKDAVARSLFRQHLVPVGLSLDTIGEQARAEFAVDVSALQKRNAEAAPPRTAELFRLFGNSLYWVDRLSTTIDDAVNDASSPPNSTEIECFLSTTSRTGGVQSALVVGVRRLVDRSHSMALGNSLTPIHFREATALAPVHHEPFRVADLQRLAHAIEAFVKHEHIAHRKGDPRLLEQAHAALAAYRQLADMLALPKRTNEKRGRGAETLLQLGVNGGATAARLTSLVVRVAANLVNNRFRLHAAVPVQSALVTIDALTDTTQSEESLSDYLHGRCGYIPGVGFVDLETYDEWMAMEEHTRLFMQRGYFSEVRPESAFYLHPASEASRYVVKTFTGRARAARTHTKRNTAELGGTTAAQRWVQNQRALARGVSFVERERRLQRYGYHQDDRMAHHAAGPNWRHYARVHHSAMHANDSDHRTLMLSVSSPTTNNLLAQFDWFVHLVFRTSSSTPISDFVAKAEAQFTQIGNAFTASPYSSFQKFLDYINTSGKCRGPQDYLLDGNGTYRLGCLPFLSERMLNWIKDFPVEEPTHNIWNIFQGPGFIEWTPEMYSVSPDGHCPLPRNPDLSCPLNRSVQTYTPNGTLVEVPANGTNFGSFITNPYLFALDFCFTDMCTVSPAYAAVRPFCPTVPTCDYCPREYLSAAEFGYTDGWKVLAMWDAMLRYLVLNFLEQPGGATGYLLLVSSFIVAQFPQYAFAWVSFFNNALPSSQTLSFIFLAATVGGDWFILMNPARFVWNFLFLEFLTLFSDVVGYVLWAVYIVVNFGPAILTFQILPFYDNVAQWIAYNLTPGPLLLLFLAPYYSFIQWFAPLIGTSVFGSPAVVRGIIIDFQTSLTLTNPSFAQVFYSFMAFYQVAQLIFYGVLYVGLFIILLGAMVLALIAFFNLLSYLVVILLALVTFYNSRRLSAARDDIEDLQDVAVVQQAELNELRAAVAAVAPAAVAAAADFRAVAAGARLRMARRGHEE